MGSVTPKFYQKVFFHTWIVLILGLFTFLAFGLFFIIPMVLLLGELIFVLQQKIYSCNNNEWKVSKQWMVGIIAGAVVFFIAGVCRFGGLF